MRFSVLATTPTYLPARLRLTGGLSRPITLPTLRSQDPRSKILWPQARSADLGQGWVGVHGRTVVRVELEVGVGGASRCVTTVADIGNHVSLMHSASGFNVVGPPIEVGVVIRVAVVPVEPESDATEAAGASAQGTAEDGVDPGTPRPEYVGSFVTAPAGAAVTPVVVEPPGIRLGGNSDSRKHLSGRMPPERPRRLHGPVGRPLRRDGGPALSPKRSERPWRRRPHGDTTRGQAAERSRSGEPPPRRWLRADRDASGRPAGRRPVVPTLS